MLSQRRAVEGNAQVEGFNLRLNSGGGVSGDWDVVEEHLDHLNFFLEVGGSWQDGADERFKFFLNFTSSSEVEMDTATSCMS